VGIRHRAGLHTQVIFFWDQQAFARDYSPDDLGLYEVILSPQALGLTRDQFFDQAKELRVQAYSLGGAVTANIRTVVQFPNPHSLPD
jgi:hypothetical protein